MYWKMTVAAGKTIEIFKSFTRYTGEKTGLYCGQATAEQIAEANEKNAVKKLTRILNANFCGEDWHVIFTYRKENRPNEEEAKRLLKQFLRKTRREYQKRGVKFKYVHVTEYRKKAIHHHIVLNELPGSVKARNIIKKTWLHGTVYYRGLDENGQYKKLAEYLIKETKETFRQAENGQKQRYSVCKGLIIPKPKVQRVRANGWTANPKAKKGYYIDEETLINGVNPYTGQIYQSYTMVRLSG